MRPASGPPPACSRAPWSSATGPERSPPGPIEGDDAGSRPRSSVCARTASMLAAARDGGGWPTQGQAASSAAGATSSSGSAPSRASASSFRNARSRRRHGGRAGRTIGCRSLGRARPTGWSRRRPRWSRGSCPRPRGPAVAVRRCPDGTGGYRTRRCGTVAGRCSEQRGAHPPERTRRHEVATSWPQVALSAENMQVRWGAMVSRLVGGIVRTARRSPGWMASHLM